MSQDEGIEALGRLGARLQRDDPFYAVRYPTLVQKIKQITASTPAFYWVRDVENAYWSIPATKQSAVSALQTQLEPPSTTESSIRPDHEPGNADISMQGILAVAKMAGACGILNSMIHFQKTTQMEGGNAFILRFWEVEAARQGKSVQELANTCDETVSAYDRVWNAIETP